MSDHSLVRHGWHAILAQSGGYIVVVAGVYCELNLSEKWCYAAYLPGL